MDQLEDFHVKYESQPRELLETIYEKKCYHLFLSAIPLFVQLIGKVDAECPLVSEIILDLLERDLSTRVGERLIKEGILALLPRIPMLHEGFILTEAVKRKIVIDFTYPLFTEGCKAFYYETILKKDCVELFILYEQDILALSIRTSISKILISHSSLQILKRIKLTKEDCKFCMGRALEKYDKDEKILTYLPSLYENQAILCLHLLRSFYNGEREQVLMLLRVGGETWRGNEEGLLQKRF